jgi:tRNA(fMet)-specific endonuclease VapC
LKYLLDTDSVSFVIRGVGNVASRLREHRPSEIGISAITLAELRFGADLKTSRKLHASIDAFVHDVEVLPFDDDAARAFGRVGALLAARGKRFGEMDTLIAGHALALERTLVTNNLRHFTRIPGLILETWL